MAADSLPRSSAVLRSMKPASAGTRRLSAASGRPQSARPVRTPADYTRQLHAGVRSIVIDADKSEWFDLGQIPTGVHVRISGNTCAAVTAAPPGAVTATDTSFVQIYGDTTITAYADAHVEALDTTSVHAHGGATVVGNDGARIRADNYSIVFAHHRCHVIAAGRSIIAATSAVAVHISTPTHHDDHTRLFANPDTVVTGTPDALTLTTTQDPIRALARHIQHIRAEGSEGPP